MTTVTLSSSETRHQKALAILASRGQWLTVKDRQGRELVGIPSQTKHGLVHLVATDGSQCDCYDFRNHGRGMSCKHTVAVRLWLVSRGADPQPQPASDTVDGLAQMLEQRLTEQKPVLEMVREPEGDISWRQAKDYDEVFARFEDDPKSLDRILGKSKPIYRTDHRLCREPKHSLGRDWECAAYLGHEGPHNFVPTTTRED